MDGLRVIFQVTFKLRNEGFEDIYDYDASKVNFAIEAPRWTEDPHVHSRTRTKDTVIGVSVDNISAKAGYYWQHLGYLKGITKLSDVPGSKDWVPAGNVKTRLEDLYDEGMQPFTSIYNDQATVQIPVLVNPKLVDLENTRKINIGKRSLYTVVFKDGGKLTLKMTQKERTTFAAAVFGDSDHTNTRVVKIGSTEFWKDSVSLIRSRAAEGYRFIDASGTPFIRWDPDIRDAHETYARVVELESSFTWESWFKRIGLDINMYERVGEDMRLKKLE